MKKDLAHVDRRSWVEYTATAVAIIVSFLSLWVAIRSEEANQRMVDANQKMVATASWPFLQINSSNGDNEGRSVISLSLDNAGVGPAKVETFELFWKGKAFPTSTALLSACCTNSQEKSWITTTASPAGVVLRAGDSRRFLRFELTSRHRRMWEAFDHTAHRGFLSCMLLLGLR